MLKKLSVKNFALIDELNIEFQDGLTIITGETGSGKSILLGALHLLLGERAESSVVRDSSGKCIVEGHFDVSALHLKDFFMLNDLDSDDFCILRREIHPNGRSRSFINDTPVTLNQMRELGNLLVDIHSQHDNLLLESSAFQLQLLDAVAKNQTLLGTYRRLFNDWKQQLKELDILRAEESKFRLEQDFIQFQFDEIEKANIAEGEYEKLEEEYSILNHAEDIRNQLASVIFLTEGDSDETGGMVSGLRSALNSMSNAANYSADVAEIKRRLEAVWIDLKDIINEIKFLHDKAAADPHRLQEISSRMDLLNNLLNKHRVKHIEEVIVLKNDLEKKIQKSDDLGQRINNLEGTSVKLEIELRGIANEISIRRKKQIPGIQKITAELLRDLGMPHAVFAIEFSSDKPLDLNGVDSIGVLFSANAGAEAKDLKKIASGGELSRLMLALKKIIASKVSLPTIIFDEIDTGVSGSLADRMGDLLHEMAENMQVITITHLPQIASKGHDHFKVYKEIRDGIGQTAIRRLSVNERVGEIASMLSGKKLSEAALMNARSLLGITNE